MVSNIYKSILAIITAALFLSACTSRTSSTPLPPLQANPLSTTVTPPTNPPLNRTPQPSLTVSPVPSPTQTIAIWTHPPLPTSTSSNTPTFTPYQILTPEEAYQVDRGFDDHEWWLQFSLLVGDHTRSNQL